jgi:hypothetical protein
MTIQSIKQYAFATMVTLLLAGFSTWLLPFGWQQLHIYYQNYTFSEAEARTLRHHPEAMLALGQAAWSALDAKRAGRLYRAVVTRDASHMTAWLNLAEAEQAAGRPDKAREIVAFVAGRTANVMFWQWPTALLAHELGMEEIFRRSTNRLILQGWKPNDTFALADAHFAGRTSDTLAALEPEAWSAYLEWLMRWGRLEDARATWQAMNAHGPPDGSILLKFVNFLISRKSVAEADRIWHGPDGAHGLTNGSFEQAVTGQGFDWRWTQDREGRWNIQQAYGQGRDHGTTARVTFYGQTNLAFHHFYQIVPVTAETLHRLTWWWRGRALTTDQGPFMEVYGYDCPDLRAAGPMLTGDRDWHRAVLEFTPPAGCQAVVVRLRRIQSRRFDNKVAGTLWLDDFNLEALPGDDAAG